MDAFAVTVVNESASGVQYTACSGHAAYFGAFQFLMPLIGSFLASTVSEL
jgi:putative Mn2+ efflux pump MntP